MIHKLITSRTVSYDKNTVITDTQWLSALRRYRKAPNRSFGVMLYCPTNSFEK